MAKKLIAWLLEADVLDLSSGLAPEEPEPEPDPYPETEPTDTGGEDAPTIAAAQQGRKHSAAPWLLLIFMLSVAGFLAFAPANWIGPTLSGWLSPMRSLVGTDASKPAPARINPGADRGGSAGASGSATAATGAISVLTGPTGSTAVTAAALATTAPGAGTAAAAATAPAAGTDTAAAGATGPSVRWFVVAGPLDEEVVPPSYREPADYKVDITTATRTAPGREVISIQLVPIEEAKTIAATLENEGFPVRIEERDPMAVIHLGPFADEKRANKAAVALVNQGVQPRAQDVDMELRDPWIRLGPFADEAAAVAEQAKIQTELGVRAAVIAESVQP